MPTNLSVDAAIQLLTSVMRNPMNANICFIRMGIAADRIDRALEASDSVSAKAKLVKSHPEFLRAGIRFLTYRQSPQDFVAMINHLCQCHCDFGQTEMRLLHTLSNRRTNGRNLVSAPTLVFDAVTTITNCIILALSELTQHRFRTGNVKSGERRWPQDPEDLLPFGPKDSLVGLEHWVAGPPHGYLIFKLVGCLATFHVPFAKEVFQYKDFTFPLARPCHHLRAAIKFYHEGDSSPLAREHFFNRPVMTIFQFFDDLTSVDTPQFNLMVLARGDWLKPILTPLMAILSTLPQEWAQIRMHVNYLSSYANADVDRTTGVAVVQFNRSQFAEVLSQRDPLENAFDVMVDAWKIGCCNIQCPSQSEPLHSRLCSGCSLIRFCGEKCQKDAWKYAPLPHKAVCAKIHSLKEALGSEDWPLLWTPDFTYAQFQVMCKQKNVDTGDLTVIASTISALRVRKVGFLEDLKNAEASKEEQIRREEQKRLANEKSMSVIESLGEKVRVIHREEALLEMHPEAYKLSKTYADDLAYKLSKTSVDDLD